MLCFWLPKTEEKEAGSNSEGSSDDNHLSKDSIQGHFTHKLFFCWGFYVRSDHYSSS